LIWLALWLFFYQPPHKNRWLRKDEYLAMKDGVRPPEETGPVAAGRVNWRKVIAMRECYTIIIARFFTDPVIYFIIFPFISFDAGSALCPPLSPSAFLTE